MAVAERGYFFVGGAPKSGTTWLQRVLDAHPHIQCSGEGHFIDKFSVPLAALLRDYAGLMNQAAEGIYEGKPYYAPLTQKDLDRLVRNFVHDRLMGRAPGPDIRWIGDKTPGYALELPSLLRLFPQGRFIIIMRDPRDVAMSRIHHARRGGHGSRVQEGSDARLDFVRYAGAAWLDTVTSVAAFADANPGIVHIVRYEAMLQDTAGEAGKIFRFLDVDHDEALLGEISRATSFEAMTGRKPGEESLTSFLRKGVARDWVGRLEAQALAVLDEVCGDAMRANGYT